MMDRVLDLITPVILTFNEEPNIGRTLANLQWAKEIVVVDSGSTDGTQEVLRADPRVRLFTRSFDSLRNQWHFATHETGIKTPWILRLDADYQMPSSLAEELGRLNLDGPENAFRVHFDYAIHSKRLTRSLYPPKAILLRQGRFTVEDAGHTEVWRTEGPVRDLKAKIVHDDWKTMSGWVASQVRYMTRELNAPSTAHRPLRDWLRRHPPLMPVAVFFYCLFGKGLIFEGRAGILYTLQRTIAEAIYSLLYLEKLIGRGRST